MTTTPKPPSVEDLMKLVRHYGACRVDVDRSNGTINQRALNASIDELRAYAESLTEGQATEEWLEEAYRLMDRALLDARHDANVLTDQTMVRASSTRTMLYAHLRKRIAAPAPQAGPPADAIIQKVSISMVDRCARCGAKGPQVQPRLVGELAAACGAVSYSPPPMRAVRGRSFTDEQLLDFARRVSAGEASQ